MVVVFLVAVVIVVVVIVIVVPTCHSTNDLFGFAYLSLRPRKKRQNGNEILNTISQASRFCFYFIRLLLFLFFFLLFLLFDS